MTFESTPAESDASADQRLPTIKRRVLLASAGMAAVAGPAGATTGSAQAETAHGVRSAPSLEGPTWKIRPFELDQVRLGEGSVFAEKRARILALLTEYPTDQILHNFRRTAGLALPPNSRPPGVWDDELGNLRGHYSGHLLTGLAQAYASTGAELYKNKVDVVVSELARCQKALDAMVGSPGTPGPLPTRVSGRQGQAISLDGNGQYAELPAEAIKGVTTVSLAAWVKPTESRFWSRVFDFGTGTTAYAFLTIEGGSGPRFAITTTGGGGEQRLDGRAPLPTDRWSHLAVTIADGVGRLYVDGTEVAVNRSMTLTPAALGSPTNNWIGRSQFGDAYLAAAIDDVVIIDRALSAAELSTLINTGDVSGGQRLRYQFEDDATDRITDSSGNARHGTARGLPATPGPQYPGYLAAYPETQFVRLEQGATYPTVWAPYYTMHKIVRGLVDAHVLVGNDLALQVASRMGDWAHARLSRLSAAQRNKIWATYIAGEYGGMNEVMADLYALTGKPEHLTTAKYFDNRQTLFNACLENRDILTRLHANTHVPQFIGYLRIFDESGDADYFEAAKNFFAMVVPERMFSHGGIGGTWPDGPNLPANTNPELIQPRGMIAGAIAANGAETCTTYNLLKLARNLFFHSGDAALMDYSERAMINHILGSKEDADSRTSPQVTYFLPLTPGSTRDFGNVGTCCGGTGLENHTKYQESIYFRSEDDEALYLNFYTASTLDWAARGLTITQETNFPRQQSSRITVTGTGRLDLRLRVPGWCTGFTVRLNGEKVRPRPVPGSYLSIRRYWRTGDVIDVSLPFTLRVERALDKPGLQSVFNGPVLLPALSSASTPRSFGFYRQLKLDGNLSSAIVSNGDGSFRTNGHELRPMFVGDRDRHHPYFQRVEPVVAFGSIDSGVANPVRTEDGISFLDDLWARAPFSSHSRFVDTVTAVSATWQQQGRLTAQNRAAIIDAARRAEGQLAG